jgi:hypothetical protein
MFKEISWQSYTTRLFVITIGYYLFILLRYYRKESRHLFSYKYRTVPKDHTSANKVTKVADTQHSSSEITLSENTFLIAFGQVEKIINEIRDVILPKAGLQADKKYLLNLLKAVAKRYQEFEVPVFRSTINSYIIKEAATQCQVTYTVQELETEWQTIIP